MVIEKDLIISALKKLQDRETTYSYEAMKNKREDYFSHHRGKREAFEEFMHIIENWKG